METSPAGGKIEQAMARADGRIGRVLSMVAATFALLLMGGMCYVPHIIFGFQEIFQDFDTELPALTRWVISVPPVLWWMLFGGGGLMVLCVECLLQTAVLRVLIHLVLTIVGLVLLGLLHMALSHNRNIEVFALLTPLVVAGPLAAQLGRSERSVRTGSRIGLVAVILVVVTATAAFAARHTFSPMVAQTPAAAVDVLKARKAARILHNAGFGGYLIAQGIPTFFDGRGELYGAPFLVNTFDALALRDVDGFLGLLETYKIDATLLTPDTPAVGLLDRLDGWQRIYADDIAVVHIRKFGAANPTIKPEGAVR